MFAITGAYPSCDMTIACILISQREALLLTFSILHKLLKRCEIFSAYSSQIYMHQRNDLPLIRPFVFKRSDSLAIIFSHIKLNVFVFKSVQLAEGSNYLGVKLGEGMFLGILEVNCFFKEIS